VNESDNDDSIVKPSSDILMIEITCIIAVLMCDPFAPSGRSMGQIKLVITIIITASNIYQVIKPHAIFPLHQKSQQAILCRIQLRIY
jgi:hypothetical protein